MIDNRFDFSVILYIYRDINFNAGFAISRNGHFSNNIGVDNVPLTQQSRGTSQGTSRD